MYLLNYFGEESDRCGVCDVCRERNELDLSQYEFEIISQDIKSALEQNNVDAAGLSKLLDHPEEKSIKVIRWLLDHDELLQDPDHRLSWKN
jgi:ATP-dependent DNA helicase RecQ